MRKMRLTCLSYFNHLGAILGMASFSASLLTGIPVSMEATPSFIDLSKSGSTFSWRLTVFSVGVISFKNILTCLNVVFDAKELRFVVASDCWVGIRVSWKEGQLVGHIVGLHFVLLYDLVFRMSLVFVWFKLIQRINL